MKLTPMQRAEIERRRKAGINEDRCFVCGVVTTQHAYHADLDIFTCLDEEGSGLNRHGINDLRRVATGRSAKGRWRDRNEVLVMLLEASPSA